MKGIYEAKREKNLITLELSSVLVHTDALPHNDFNHSILYRVP